MLDARGRRAAERERQRGNERAAAGPAAIASVEDDGRAAKEQRGEGRGVGGAEIDARIDPRQCEVQRREQQRLRIGDLGSAREHVGGPQRRLAVCQRRGEETELRLELRLGVPRNRHRAGEPGKRQRQK